MSKKSFFSILLLSIIFYSCDDKTTINRTVQHHGALNQIMSGNLEATASLDSLQALPHLYALGALQDLKGEIQIYDGAAYVSTSTANNRVDISASFDHKASLLVYTQVPQWTDGIELTGFDNSESLEIQIKAAALKNGIDINEPFPFLLKGQAILLHWHVINWINGDMDHNHKKHIESGSQGVLESENVEILGFYSEKHQAVFTHHTTFLHMHFKTLKNPIIAGHVDDLHAVSLELHLPQL